MSLEEDKEMKELTSEAHEEEDMDAMNDDSSDDDDDEEEDDDDDDDEDEDEEKEKTAKEAFIPGKNKLKSGEELVMDEQSYVVYHQASLGPPCLSFDVITDDLGDDRGSQYPLTLFGVAGTQAAKVNSNCIVLFKMYNLNPISKTESDDDEDDDVEEIQDAEKTPKLKVASIKHPGIVNRIRYQTLGSVPVAAAWSDAGSVSIWNLRTCLQKLDCPDQGSKDWYRDSSDPLYRFGGHTTEGYALDWCPTSLGVLATGDCKRDVHIWKPMDGGSSWAVDQRPLKGHSASVEDLQWSPNEANVLASCSVDRSIRIWDVRAQADQACMLTVDAAHESDVNVINWNRNEPFIVSGGDDGIIKIWDLRQLESKTPVASFKHHNGPITSVEWHHSDATVLASSGEDDQVALWDLAIERDDENDVEGNVKDLPPQLLFIHQGLQDVKEIHWHKQIPGLMITTSNTGLDVFRTISV